MEFGDYIGQECNDGLKRPPLSRFEFCVTIWGSTIYEEYGPHTAGPNQALAATYLPWH